MTTLKDRAGEIEVRIMKPPFDAVEPEFFDEYVDLGVRYTGRNACTRYITPESQTYAIFIIVKSGYDWGTYPRMHVEIFDKATKVRVLSRGFSKACAGTVSDEDQVFQVDSIYYAAVDGEARIGVKLAFIGMVPGK